MNPRTQGDEAPPPILKRWSRLYGIVVINLVFWLSLFYLLRWLFE